MKVRFLAALTALLPAAALLVAVGTTPPAADSLPSFEIATAAGPIHLSAAEMGAELASEGLQVDEARLDAAVARLADAVRVPAAPDGYELVGERVIVRPGRPGIELDRAATKDLLTKALRGRTSNLTLPVHEAPKPPPPEHAIVVTLQHFRLHLYRNSELSSSYEVGVGALRFPTPPGAYHIRSKAKNPSWTNPGSRWARSMPRHVPPGPRNPLGTRALRLDRGALVIHGTPQPWTVGRRSSHGCIRMRKGDVEQLFEIVAVGTPVFIVP